MKVIAIINESKGELLASVYSVNRGTYGMADGSSVCSNRGCSRWKKGISSILSLVFTMLCIFYFSSDDLQRNIPDTGGCISGRIYNSCDDVYG